MPNSTVTYPAVSLGSLTFTAKRWAQFPTITLIDGAVAGSELVTMDSSFNITIKIQSGVSTNLQIKNAVLATINTSGGLGVNDVVSVSITSGHNADTQVAAQTTFSGGQTSAVKAKVQVGGLIFTAHTAGTGGNSLQVRYTSGATAGSEVVTDPNSNGHPLQIQIADYATPSYAPIGGNPSNYSDYKARTTGSTLGQVLAAINTWQSGHTTYFDVTLAPGFSTADPAFVSSASVAVSLVGGKAAAPSVASLQGVTATSNANTSVPNGLTLTFTPGGTAGAEVVTDNMDGSFSIQIQSGVSTPTQIASALNADATFFASYTASFSGSTAVVADWRVAMSGAVGPQLYAWETDSSVTTLTTTFVYFPFNDSAQDFFCVNNESSGNKQVIGSWDGTNNHFILNPGQQVYLGTVRRPGVYLKEANGAPAFAAWTIGR